MKTAALLSLNLKNYLYFPKSLCLLTHLSKATTTVRKMEELNKEALVSTGAYVSKSSLFTLLSTTESSTEFARKPLALTRTEGLEGLKYLKMMLLIG